MVGSTRRSLLRLSGGLLGAGLFGGCIGESPVGGDDASTETTTGESILTVTAKMERMSTATNATGMVNLTDNNGSTSCDSDVSRFEPPIDEVQYESLAGFELSASRTSVELGDPITFHLQNTTDNQLTTGVRDMNDVQRRTNDGWQSIYWVSGIMGYPAKGVIHSQGEGFTWEFTVSREGFRQPVCEGLSSGEYRFVYWGITPPEEETSNVESENAIGMQFSIER